MKQNFETRTGSRPAGRATSVLLAFLTALLLPPAITASAQEAIRMSLAGEASAQQRREADSTLDYYNLKIGPTALRFSSGLGVEYNDNVNYTDQRPEGDCIFTPQLQAQWMWPLTEKNCLHLTVAAGYMAYVDHPVLDRFFLNPGSGLSFDLYSGDFWFNFHDRYSITEASYQDPTVAGTGNYVLFENALGETTVWDLNKVVLRAGYDHGNYIALRTDQAQPDGQGETFFGSAGYTIKPQMLLGLEAGGTLVRYSSSSTNKNFSNATQWNLGAFYDAQVSGYFHVKISGGYSLYSPDGSGQSGKPGDFGGLYAQIDATHRVNSYLDYLLSAGRNINFTFYGGTVDLYYARLWANWKILRDMSLKTSLDFNHGSEVTGASETFDQYGAGISIERMLTAKLTGNLGYQCYLRDSNQSGRGYTANLVNLNLTYSF